MQNLSQTYLRFINIGSGIEIKKYIGIKKVKGVIKKLFYFAFELGKFKESPSWL